MRSTEDPEVKQSSATIKRRLEQRNKRRRLYLKGPIDFGWIQDNIPDTTSRVVLVATAFMDMARSSECPLDGKVWACAGITTHDQRRRILAKIRKMLYQYEVIDRPGRPSLLRRRSS